MILIFVRHAIAMEREDFARYCLEKGIDPDDEQRPLTEEGQRKMKKNAEGLVRILDAGFAREPSASARTGLKKVRPIIISSPLVRAVETAAIISKAYGQKKNSKPDLTTSTLAPGTPPKAFRDFLYDFLHSRPGRSHVNTMVIVVGHEPQLSTSLGLWVIGKEKARFPFKKGGATCLEIGHALTMGEARLLWSLPPWALRSQANRVKAGSRKKAGTRKKAETRKKKSGTKKSR